MSLNSGIGWVRKRPFKRHSCHSSWGLESWVIPEPIPISPRSPSKTTVRIGFLSPQGDAVFNVPIRTVVLEGDRGEMGIGSGITHDSNPQDEWQECLLKGRFLTHPIPEFKLIETPAMGPGRWLLVVGQPISRDCGTRRNISIISCDKSRSCPGGLGRGETRGGQSRADGCGCCSPRTVRLSFQGQPCPWPRLRQLPIPAGAA